MALPTLTREDREAALLKAAEVRKARAEVKKLLKQGSVTLPAVLKDAATDDAIAKMKVLALVESMPGVGKIRAGQIMERLAIDPKRRVRGLGPIQRQALEDEFAAA